jgi:H+/Cl- antiporter ClcA
MNAELKKISLELLIAGAVFALAFMLFNHIFFVLIIAGACLAGVIQALVSAYLFPESGRLFEPKDRT